MSDWYVFDQGDQKGPFAGLSVVDFLRSRDPARVHVWRQGMADWLPVNDVPELIAALGPPPPPPPPPVPALPPPVLAEPAEVLRRERSLASDEPCVAKSKLKWAILGALVAAASAFVQIEAGENRVYLENPDVHAVVYLAGYLGGAALIGALVGFGCARLSGSSRQRKISPILVGSPEPVAESPLPASPAMPRYNVLRRHWRGELRLWVSYWVFGFVGNLVTVLITILIAALFRTNSGFYPPAIFATIITTWAAIAGVVTWQFVGVWRSAAVYSAARLARGKGSGWAALAQIAVGLGVFRVIWAFADAGAPQIAESYRMAFADDPDIPSYSIRVMRDGTEAEIVGGIKYGLADDFTKILDASRGVRLVHLDSIGGRLGEGEKLFRLIRERGLSTYVSSQCMSACTLAFAGGRQRFLRQGASLGFHQGAFPGLKERNFDSVQADVFRLAGFDESFIRRALATPSSDIWEPSTDVLIAAKVVTGLTDGTKVTWSAPDQGLDRERIAAQVVNASPVFTALRARFPKKFDEIVDLFMADLARGRTFTETTYAAGTKMLPFVRELLPMADDDVLADYNRLLVDEYFELRDRDPIGCYRYASGHYIDQGGPPKLSEGLTRREQSMQAKVITTATRRRAADEAQIDSLWTIVLDDLAVNGVGAADVALLETPEVETSKQPRYCSVAIAFHRAIGRLEAEQTAMLMRDLLHAR